MTRTMFGRPSGRGVRRRECGHGPELFLPDGIGDRERLHVHFQEAERGVDRHAGGSGGSSASLHGRACRAGPEAERRPVSLLR